MAKVNLAAMSLKDLVRLQTDLPAVIAERARAERAEVRARLDVVAREAGYSLDEILGSVKGRRGGAGKTAAVKYRNPDNPSETWSGRGRTANWLREKLNKRGAKIEDFAV